MIVGFQEIKTYKNKEDAKLNGAFVGIPFFNQENGKIEILQ